MVPGTLNLALHVGDEVELVLQNRRLFAQALGLDASKFTTCEQVHGSNVAVVDEALVGAGATALADTIKDTDALVTNLSNVPLLLFFADCVPLLFADHAEAAFGEVIEHLLVVHEFAVNGDGARPGDFVNDGERVAHAEAHAQDVGFDDFHGVILCLQNRGIRSRITDV